MTLQTALTTAAGASGAIAWAGGDGWLKATGTWGSGTLTMTWCETSGGTYVGMPTAVTLTADGVKTFTAPVGFLKFALTGSTGATVTYGVATTSKQLGTYQ